MPQAVLGVAILALVATVPPTSTSALPAPSVLLDEAIGQTKAMALKSGDVDWPALEAKVRKEASGAEDIVDLLPALNTLVEGLGDGHSFVNASAEDRAQFRQRHGREFNAPHPVKKVTSAFRSRRTPEGRTLRLTTGKSIQLVTVPSRQGGGAAGSAYANSLYSLVASGAATSCGYIVDLRGNQGGNVWLMVSGLAPLLGDGWRSHEIGRDRKRTSAGYLKGDSVIAGDGEYAGQTIVKIDGWKPLPRLARVPVGVLIDDAVASSGEGVAVAFKPRPLTRFFGGATFGVASSNQGFMVGDRVNMVVTTAMMADRHGRTFPNGIAPDETVTPGPGSAADSEDATVEAAKAWLTKQKPCQR